MTTEFLRLVLGAATEPPCLTGDALRQAMAMSALERAATPDALRH